MLLCILSTVTLAFGQTATTSLRGVIKDPSGALVPGATVTLVNNANGNTLSTTSTSSGSYVFTQISPAKYTIKVTSAGFGEQTKTAELLVNQPASIDFTLTVQASSVTVDVSATAQTLNTADASIGNSADNELIQALPSETRNVPDLLSLQPGVLYLGEQNTAADSRQGAVNGGRSDQGNVTLDGVDNNDQVNGYAFTGVLRATQDSVEEFRVTTGNSNADSGRSSGAQISMVTKSGTNKFHGSAYEYHRPTFTVANNWFNKQAQFDSGLPNIPGKLIRNIFGGTFGGPIKKDKLFFFANYEATRKAENAQVTQTVPTAAYRTGNLLYPDANNNTVTLSSAQVAGIDGNCQVCNTTAYPSGPGPNPNALGFFSSMPAANGLVLGDGYNTGSYSFSSPAPQSLNTSIVKLDFVPSDKHRIFVRGNLQKDTTAGVEQFPGQPPSTALVDNSKGFTVGDTWTISPTIVNDIRYGYVRQGFGLSGVGKGDYVDFRFISTPTAETRSTITSVPVNNVVDNLSWSKGKHNFQFGGNWRLIHQNHSSDAISYNGASTNPYWLGGSIPQPDATIGAPSVNGGFGNSYQVALANLLGTVPSLTNNFNYKIDSATSGTLLADGAFIDRHFKANEFEWYVQDAWRMLPNLTVTFGVRHTILQTPYETSGQQVAPTIDTHAWYLKRESAAQAGQVYEDDLQFAPTGPYYGKPGYWAKSKNNFAPRLAIAYSPDNKTSIRLGAGIYYDHYGEALVSTFDQNGSFGMSSSVTNPAGLYSMEGSSTHPGSPRFMGRNVLPPINNGASPTTQTFPYYAPQGNFAITWGLDNKIKTPYSETFDFSVQRELPGGFTLETAYVGRLGRHLLQQLDLAEPVDYVDPQGAGDYYTAGTQLSKTVDQNGGVGGLTYDVNGNPTGSLVNVAPIQYFENLFPFMANLDYTGQSATQAIYDNEWAPYRGYLGATTALSDIDFFCAYYYPCPANYQSKFWQDQFSSLYALSSIGTSYYNAGQIILRHPMSRGLQMDFSYTLSKSIDMGSDSERSNEFGSSGNGTGAFSEILNTWKPQLNRAPSDFDTRHLITADYVYQLPVGRGKTVLSGANKFLDGFIGGWQLTGTARWSSGLPFSLYEPGWSTDWQIESYGVVTGKVKMRRHFDQNGAPQFFDDPNGINNGVATGGPIRLPYPGEAGQRNNFRGDGYFDLSPGLDKTWKIREYGALKFAWEVYNATNTVRFDPASIGAQLTGGNLGVAGALLTQPRRMQFSLRYDF
ncbi:MAG: carboxypeptidase regulatory-like domain-containing protein [Acidobacteriota bacterium]|nr:carboxypeptidase regulatory-like domain-containing protein [Acidobacteriota bacterium]